MTYTPYTKQEWENGRISSPYGPLSGDRLQHLEDGLDAASQALAPIANGGSVPALAQSGVLVNQGNGPNWMEVRAADDVLFVACANDSLVKAYDASGTNAQSPVLLGSVTVGPSTAYIGLVGNYLLVADSAQLKLRVVDATTPASMSVSATLTYDSSGGTGGGRFNVSPDGNHVLIGGPENGTNANKAVLVDITTKASPSVAGRTAAFGSTHRGVVALSNTVWAVSSRDEGKVYIVDCSTPASPVASSSFASHGVTTTPLALYNGTVLLVGDYGTPGYVAAWDVSTPASPSLLSFVQTSIGSERIVVKGSKAYVSLRASNSIARIDLSNLAAITLDGIFAVTGTVTTGVQVSPDQDYAYLTAGGDTANGLIYVFETTGTLLATINALQSRADSIRTQAAFLAASQTLTGANTFTGTVTLGQTTPAIVFGAAGDQMQRTSSGNVSFLVNLTVTNLLASVAGRVLGFKTASGNGQFNYTVDGDGTTRWGDGTSATDVRLYRKAANVLSLLTADLQVETVGKGLKVAEGSNAKQGVATLVAGTVTVSNTSVTASSRIQLTAQDNNSTGALRVSARTAGTSFTITSSNSGDTGVVAYEIFEPAA